MSIVAVAPSKLSYVAEAAKAKSLYLETRNVVEEADDWRRALRDSRRVLANALRASDYLTDIPAALTKSGAHMLALRQFFAPPISQDQFKLLCPTWPKSSERTRVAIVASAAHSIAEVFHASRDKYLTRWLEAKRRPTRTEIRELLLALSPLIAAQTVATTKRNRLATKQEQAVVQLLEQKGWTRMASSLIDRRASVPEKCFMQKTRFATATSTPQEVDIACGLPGTIVLAMECKVTNDETNSVKRINDILKKAEAWKTHWGSFVVTAALLQGVIKANDVKRLMDSGIHVFWSHDLDAFSAWLDDQF